MKSENQKRLEALPTFLRPKLRLFLSVDLVGSTASKQQPRFPIDNPKDNKITPPWLLPIASFFGSFQESFVSEWRLFREQHASRLGIEVLVDPAFWKANGDELIFVKEITDYREVQGCVDAWLKALHAQRKSLALKPLDVKATAWIAGFPVINSEFVFRSVLDPDTPFEGDPRLQQFALLNKWHEEPSVRHQLTIDFIGPSIDVGFRLAALASPRRFIVSAEVAYYLSISHFGFESPVPDPSIFYSGGEILKGVLGGKPYPVFWVDAAVGETYEQAEDAVSSIKPVSKETVERFCIEFFRKHSTLIIKPFVYSDGGSEHERFPDNYIERLEHLNYIWTREANRLEGEELLDQDALPDDLLDETASIEKEEAIRAALKAARAGQDVKIPTEQTDQDVTIPTEQKGYLAS